MHRTADENSKLCSMFSKFFTDKICALKRTVTREAAALATPPPSEIKFTGDQWGVIQPVTVDEVRKLLACIPAKSSPLDFMPTSLLKSCCGVFSEVITRLANLSFAQGVFPSKYKFADVTPI